MASQYTTKTASLRATRADIKKIDTKQMMINGENITELWGLNLPKDYKKLVTRCELPDDKNWMLLNDNGDLVYFNFSEKIINGFELFKSARFHTFDYDLNSLQNGNSMFMNCTNLTTFSSDLPNLTNGDYMFYECTALTSFTSDLPNLTNGDYMFYYCKNLTTFTSDLSSLTNGTEMFINCEKLQSIDVNLQNLVVGQGMFSGCNLDGDTFERILDTLSENSNNNLIGITLSEEGCIKACELLGIKNGNIGEYPDGMPYLYEFKGWILEMTTQKSGGYQIGNGGSADCCCSSSCCCNPPLPECPECPECSDSCCCCSERPPLPAAITSGGAYIPDASKWNQEVYLSQGLNHKVTKVIDGWAYDN